MRHSPKSNWFSAATALLAIAVIPAGAADRVPAGLVLESKDPSPNRFGISYRMGFNISADFKNIGFTSKPLAAPGVHGVSRIYDDGYNRVDSTGNGADLTTYWGYQNAGQISGGNTVLTLNKIKSSSLATSRGVEDDPQHGFELNYSRHLGDVGRCHWGIEAALGYTRIEIRDSRPFDGGATQIADDYDITGLAFFGGPPPAPYSGPFAGNASTTPVIPDSPFNRTTTSYNDGRITGQRQLDANLVGLRFGPYLEIPCATNLSVSLSGGLVVAWLGGDFRFKETVDLGPGGVFTSSGSSTKHSALVGGYAGANLNYDFSKRWSAFVGAQYQYLGDYTQKAGAKEVRLDLGKSVFVSIGAGYSF